MSKKDNIENKEAVSASRRMNCSADGHQENAERATPEEIAVKALRGCVTYVPNSVIAILELRIARAVREAIELDRKDIAAMLTDGSYCRYVDHAQDLCECDEIKKNILARAL